jgi:hypothetical protein
MTGFCARFGDEIRRRERAGGAVSLREVAKTICRRRKLTGPDDEGHVCQLAVDIRKERYRFGGRGRRFPT